MPRSRSPGEKKSSSKLKKKRKNSSRDDSLPKQPPSGYVRFISDRRETVKNENPNLSNNEITRLLANEWGTMPPDQKKTYLNAAEEDKEKYLQEIAAYKQSSAYQEYNESRAKKFKTDEISKDSENYAYDIPIFTEEFLDFNKNREVELRQLRKMNSDLEQEYSVLEKHVEGVKQAVEKLQVETQQRKASNEALEKHLRKMRTNFVNKLSQVSIPEIKETPTEENIDQYVVQLYKLLQEKNVGLFNKVKQALSGLDFKS